MKSKEGEKSMGWMFYAWVIILIAAVIFEIATTELTSIWFACGAFVALILNLFIKDELIPVQIAVFAVISVVSIILIKPLVKRKMFTETIPTNADALIGKIAVVTASISLNYPGAVKIEGIEWTAICNDEDSYEIGDLVEIVEIKGNTMTIKRK